MTKVEEAVRAIHAEGGYPSTWALGTRMGRSGASGRMGFNARERAIRDRVLRELGVEPNGVGRRLDYRDREKRCAG